MDYVWINYLKKIIETLVKFKESLLIILIWSLSCSSFVHSFNPFRNRITQLPDFTQRNFSAILPLKPALVLSDRIAEGSGL